MPDLMIVVSLIVVAVIFFYLGKRSKDYDIEMLQDDNTRLSGELLRIRRTNIQKVFNGISITNKTDK